MDPIYPTVDSKIAIAPLALAAGSLAVPAIGKAVKAVGAAAKPGATLSKPKTAGAIYPPAQTAGGAGHTNPGSKPNKGGSSTGPTNKQVGQRGATDVLQMQNDMAKLDATPSLRKVGNYVPIPEAPKPQTGMRALDAAHLALGMAPLALGVVDTVRRNRQDERHRYEAEKAHLRKLRELKRAVRTLEHRRSAQQALGRIVEGAEESLAHYEAAVRRLAEGRTTEAFTMSRTHLKPTQSRQAKTSCPTKRSAACALAPTRRSLSAGCSLA